MAVPGMRCVDLLLGRTRRFEVLQPGWAAADGEDKAHPRRLGMTRRLIIWPGVRSLGCMLGALVFTGILPGPGVGLGAEKPLMVHYMPWFQAKPYSEEWGYHWTLDSVNPDTIDGSGRRKIASHYHPLIGPYDSADPVVLEYHVLLMKLAGLDGVIMDWYGTNAVHDFAINNDHTLAMLGYIRRAGLRFALCYEDWTIQAAIAAGHIPATGAVAHAQETMLYAQTHYFQDLSYLRLADEHPVLLNFGPRHLKKSGEWTAVFSVLAASNHPAFFTLNRRLPAGTGSFNWPPMHLSRTNAWTLDLQVLNTYLDRFEQKGSDWPAYISSAFPRFHDFYKQSGVGSSYGYLDDNDGLIFRSTLTRAMTNNSTMIQLVTWNDFGEGTVLEPTTEYGYRDLEVIQSLRRTYMDAAFPYQPDDLRLASRLYDLRRERAGTGFLSKELDRVFEDIVSGDVEMADNRLAAIEAREPVVYGASVDNGVLRFSVGGYVTETGVSLQTTSSLALPWQTIRRLAVNTGRNSFSTSISPSGAPAFFRVIVSEP